LREERKLRVFDNMVLRKDEVGGEWRRLLVFEVPYRPAEKL